MRATRFRATKSSLFVEFDDGNAVKMPWAITKTLAYASDAERAKIELVGGGTALRWPLLNEDVAAGVLANRDY